jgi:pimeloyl-ACP methyl ester carboxylesterase
MKSVVATLVALCLASSGMASASPSPTVGAAHKVDGNVGDWFAPSDLVPGTASYEAGQWSFTDYPYDDHGAGGTFIYPDDVRYSRNAADIVVLQITVDKKDVHYLARFDTLTVPDATVLALAVDTDANERTGGGRWPYGADVSTPGWEHVITVWGTGGVVTTSRGPVRIPAAANTTENVIEFSVPRKIADPKYASWRYRGGTGVWDKQAKTWAEVVSSSPTGSGSAPSGGTGSASQPDVFNLLFRNRSYDGGTKATDENESDDFQYALQSAALASGKLGPFYRDVSFRRMRSNTTIVPTPPPGDLHFTRVFSSRAFPNKLEEGVTSSGSTGSLYNGKFQPYRMFVPASYRADPRPAPLLPLLHGWTGNHRGFNPENNEFWNKVVRSNRALAPKPLGRGEEMWYEHIGELDVLEVMRDVALHYNVDPKRIYLGGTSMGGLGTIKIAEAHPDLFAGIFPSVPPMSDRATGYAVPAANNWDLVEQADNLRNVPVRNFTGTYDALVPLGNDSRRFCDRLNELTYDYDCWRDISSDGTHRGYENDRAAQIAQLMDEHSLVRDPSRVTYELHPVWYRQAVAAGVNKYLTYASAYWVSGMFYRAPASSDGERRISGAGYGTVDARTFGLGFGDPIASTIEDDPSPTLMREGLVLTPAGNTQRRNVFEATLANLRSVTFDLKRMGLSLQTPLYARLRGDGALTLNLIGTARSCVARSGGANIPLRVMKDRLALTVTLASATKTVAVSCR